MSVVKGAVNMAVKYFTDGRSSASGASQTTTPGQNPARTMATTSPFESAINTGRMHERDDVLTYLTSLAVVTQIEELWEAITYIKNGSHKR